MRPRHVVDKALQELRADDAAGGAVAGDVLDVGGIAIDGAGLDASRADYTALISRSVSLLCRRW